MYMEVISCKNFRQAEGSLTIISKGERKRELYLITVGEYRRVNQGA